MATDTNPFPTLEDDLDIVVLEDELVIEDVETSAPYGTCWEFDFDKGDIRLTPGGDMVVLTEFETLRQWCQHVLNVVRGESPIFGENAGTNLAGLTGKNLNDNYILAQISQEIVRGLSQHDRVASVKVTGVIPVGHEVFAFVEIVTNEDEVVESLFALSS